MKIHNINGKAYIEIVKIEDVSIGNSKSIWKIILSNGTEIITKKLEIIKEESYGIMD